MTGEKPKLATAWLDGCSGCHMSLLDVDEGLVDLLGLVDLVCSPLMDVKVVPEGTDVVLVEGAVSSADDLERARELRRRCGVVVALGDCAVTSNVPGMRNRFGRREVLARAYLENVDCQPQTPVVGVPRLLDRSRPLHEVVPVDVFVPGCPPPPEAIVHTLTELLAGRKPDPSSVTRFGR